MQWLSVIGLYLRLDSGKWSDTLEGFLSFTLHFIIFDGKTTEPC